MRLVSFFHKSKSFRNLAKTFARKVDLKQRFYGGAIFLNAVEHSWAWTGNKRYSSFDAGLQQFIHDSSKSFDYFVDIGSNIGVMVLGTLLNNKNIKCVAIDPNITAVKLLKKSLAYNNLAGRCDVINAAVGVQDGFIRFDTAGSVTGHVANRGIEVKVISITSLFNKYNSHKKFVKIDIEGYEAVIIDELLKTGNLHNFKFIIDLHPLLFNEAGNPTHVFNMLRKHNATISDLHGNKIESVLPEHISQIVVEF